MALSKENDNMRRYDVHIEKSLTYREWSKYFPYIILEIKCTYNIATFYLVNKKS